MGDAALLAAAAALAGAGVRRLRLDFDASAVQRWAPLVHTLAAPRALWDLRLPLPPVRAPVGQRRAAAGGHPCWRVRRGERARAAASLDLTLSRIIDTHWERHRRCVRFAATGPSH